MKTATYIKLDLDVKQYAQRLAKDLGFSLSAIINAQLKEFVRAQKLVVSNTPEMSLELEELLGPAIADIKARRNLIGPMKTAADVDRVFAQL